MEIHSLKHLHQWKWKTKNTLNKFQTLKVKIKYKKITKIKHKEIKFRRFEKRNIKEIMKDGSLSYQEKGKHDRTKYC